MSRAAAAALAVGLAVASPRRPPLCPRCLLRGERVVISEEHVCEATERSERCARCRRLRQVRVTLVDERGSLSRLQACGCSIATQASSPRAP